MDPKTELDIKALEDVKRFIDYRKAMEQLQIIFEKFPATMMSIELTASSMIIPLNDLLDSKQTELFELLVSLRPRNAVLCYSPDEDQIMLSASCELSRAGMFKLYHLIQSTIKSYSIEKQAFTDGSVMGTLFCWKNGLPPDLGKLVGSFLDGNRDKQLTQICRQSFFSAMEEKYKKIEEIQAKNTVVHPLST